MYIYGITQDPKTLDYMVVLEEMKQGTLRSNLLIKKYNPNDKYYNLSYLAKSLSVIHKCNLVHGSFNSNDILFIKAVKDYCQIYLSNDTRVMALGNLKSFIDKHGLTDSFIRVHKSYVIPADRVKEINSPGIISLKKYNIPIGRKYRKDVLDSFKHKDQGII